MRVALALVLTVIVFVGGGVWAGWLLGARKVELHWQNELKKANLKALQLQDIKKKQIKALEGNLVAAAEEAKALREAEKVWLEKQRDLIPLSDACSKCRVPRERLLVPEKRGSATGGGKGTKTTKGKQSSVGFSKGAGLLRSWDGVYSARARGRIEMP